MIKDKKTTVVINSEINKLLEEDGMSVQKVVNKYVKEHYEVIEKAVRRKNEKTNE